MIFCPKCGAMLIPKKGKNKTVCSCGHVHTEGAKLTLSEEVESKEEIQVIDERDKIDTLPITTVECEKCGHDKARFWTQQTRSADEAETRFFRCEKCGHVWRDAA